MKAHNEYLQLQNDALTIAKKAMDILVPMQGKETTAVQKDEGDLSTSADLASEAYIIDAIKALYPNHAIYSEERGDIPGTDPYRWVIDPLDGTKEFVRGLEEYNCLIAIEHHGQPVVGVTIQHGLNNTYVASKGNGAFLNTKPLHVSLEKPLATMFVGFNLPNRKLAPEAIENDLSLLNTLIHTVYRVRPCWDQAKAMAWVARGALDANVTPGHVFKWHDLASSIPIVQEAGGIITDWHGNPVTENTITHGVIASHSRKTHDQFLALIHKSI